MKKNMARLIFLFSIFLLASSESFSDEMEAPICSIKGKEDCSGIVVDGKVDRKYLGLLADVKTSAACYSELMKDPLCFRQAISVEEELAYRANVVKRTYLDVFSKVDAKDSPEVSEATKNTAELSDTYNRIAKTIPMAGSLRGDPAHLGFNDYGRYEYRFNFGYEFTGINNISGSSFPRLGFLVYNKNDWVHYYGLAQLTSTAEKSFGFCSDDNTSGEEGCSNVSDIKNGDNALDAEGMLFFPIPELRGEVRRGVLQEWGPVLSWSGTKNSDLSNYVFSTYIGLRTTTNPQQYAEMRLGKVGSSNVPRFDIRGQFSIYRYKNGSKMYLGYNFNTRFPFSQSDGTDVDVLRFYLAWDIDVADVFGLSASTSSNVGIGSFKKDDRFVFQESLIGGESKKDHLSGEGLVDEKNTKVVSR